MLRKFLIPTVIVSILLLLTTLITIAKTEVTSVVTSTTATSVTTTTAAAATTTAVPTTATTTTRVKSTTPRHQRVTIVQAQSANSKGTRVIYYGRKISNNSRSYSSRITANSSSSSRSSSSSSSKADINKSKNKQHLLNNAEETTTSLLPLQPPLNVTSTTTASLILQTEQQQQKRTQQLQQHHHRHQQQKKSKQQQQPRQHHNSPQHEIRQNRQSKQDVADATTTTTTQPTQKHLINVPQTENDRRTVNLIKNSTEVLAKVELVTPVPPTSTHAYIPFDLDYNDPTEEKSRPPEIVRQSTINEVLSNLFPKGFSDIFRFSYAADPEPEEQPATTTTTTTTTSTTPFKPTQIPIVVIKSTPMPFKLMPTEKDLSRTTAVVGLNTPFPFKPMPTEGQKWLEGFHENESPKVQKSEILSVVTEKIEQPNDLNITKSQEVDTGPKVQPIYTPENVTQTQEIYTTADPEVEPITNAKLQEVVNKSATQSAEDSGSTEIVVEQIMTALGSGKSSEEFRDGSNSISKDELLRINRAAKEASVLPSLLVNPQANGSVNKTNYSIPEKAIVILNERGNDDFIEAPEDDNQIAESQNIAHGVYQSPPQSVSYQQGQNHEINVHIIHDDSLRKSQDSELQKRAPNGGEQPRNLHSYQSFVEQAKYLQNSLQEAPSRKFLKNFNPTLSEGSNPGPVAKGNFHYEQAPESHIQTVPPAAQLQYVLIQRPQQQQQQEQQQLHQQQQQQQQHEQSQHPQQNNQQVQLQPSYGPTHEVSQLHTQISDSEQDTQADDNGNRVHVFHIQLPLNMPSEDEKQPQYRSTQEATRLHNHITNYINDNDAYHTVDAENNEKYESVTPMNLIFVTLNTPEPPKEESYARHQPQHAAKGPILGISKPFKTPSEFVHEAINAEPEPIPDHQPEETENSPKPSGGDSGGRYTYVEVQKSINIHNKLITEKDGRLIEQHETIYPEPKYGDRIEYRPPLVQHVQQHHQAPPDYVSLSQNPIHVAQLDESGEQHELAESLHAEQHALDPSQSLVDIGPIQQSNLVQESHIIETPIQNAPTGPSQGPPHYAPTGPSPGPPQYVEHIEHQEVEEHSQHVESHDLPEPSQNPDQPPVQIPYALPPQQHPQQQHSQYRQHPLILQEIVEKHVHIPYAVPEPVAVPVAVQHFIDRPVPIETIVEKPIPYPVETIVEKVVEKHVPVEVERIVEKPVEKVVEKYIDRPVAIPIKIPVALQLPSHSSYYSPHFPLTFGGSGPANYGAWQQPPTLARIPTKVLQSYYAKMLKKLVPQMQQAFKTSPLATKPKTVTKFTAKPGTKQQPKQNDMRYDLKPPPPPALGSSWDVGARYQYDYNTLPLDLSASSSTAVGKQAERPAVSYNTNYDEFQRWRNGHSLKRSPELGMNLHVEYGFKPPLVPSVEIDDKGVPLRAAADLTKGKEE